MLSLVFARLRPWRAAAAALLILSCAASGQQVQGRARLLVDKGQYPEAVRELRIYLGEHPKALAERRLLVRVLALSGDLGAAEKEAQTLAEQLGGQSPVPWIELGHAFELAHRYDEALTMYDRAGRVAPSDPAGPLEGGMRSARWGQAEWALPRLEEALRRNPRNARAWHALGLVRLSLGKVTQAKVAYERGLAADPKALENRIGLATAALVLKNPAEALRQYDMIIKAKPRFADARLGRALVLMQMSRYDEAEAELKAGQRFGADARVVDRQRRFLARLRDREPSPEPEKNQ